MRDGWKFTKFGTVCNLERTYSNGAQLPYVGLEDIIGGTGGFSGSTEPRKVQSSTFKFTSDHILYGRLRPYLNKVFLPDFDGHCSTEIFPIRPTSNADRRYLYYWLSMDSTVREIDLTSTGARMPRANLDAILEFSIPIPPLPEQQRIVAILEEAFAGLVTATANAEKNLKNARELFDSYLDSIFEKRGDGWIDRKLEDMCERVSVGHVGPTSQFYCEEGDGIPFLRSQNVRPGRMDFDGLRYVTKEFHRTLKKSQLKAGDLLFVRVGANRGDCCSIPEGIAEMNCANIVFARPRDQVVKFLEYYCMCNQGRRQLLGMTTGSAQGVINTGSVAELIVPIPSVPEQRRIVEVIDALAAESNRLESIYLQKLSDLSDLRQSILQKAFSGELTSPRSSAVKEAAE